MYCTCIGLHKFAQSNKYFIPSSDYDKDKLFMADLGEKVIGFTKLDMDSDEFCGVLYDSYPKLRDAGGYVMCRAKKNSNELEKLSKVVYVSPLMLKERCGPNKTYIVPLQRDLSLQPSRIVHDYVSACIANHICISKHICSSLQRQRNVCIVV